MADKISTGQTSYQVNGGNSRGGFDRDCGNLYGRGRGIGFNPEKTKLWWKCESSGSDVYYIRDSRQAYKYTKTTEGILNYIQGNYNKDNYVKEAL